MAKYWLLDHFAQFFYRILLFWLHGVLIVARELRLLSNVRDLYKVARGKMGQYYKRHRDFFVDPEKLRRVAGELSRKPKHLIVVLMSGNGSHIEEISNVAIWSICLGTPFITLYSKDGTLYNSQEMLKKVILKKLKRLLGNDMRQYSFIFKDSSSSYDNGYVNTTGICIQVISEQDCRGDLVDVSRQIADQCKSNELSLDEIDHYRIGSKLKATKGLPDPDLAIHFGRVQCLDGCLPWQLRLTEILSFGDLACIDFEKFAKGLRKFNKCEQRCGK